MKNKELFLQLSILTGRSIDKKTNLLNFLLESSDCRNASKIILQKQRTGWISPSIAHP
jgi:hypothetical protein